MATLAPTNMMQGMWSSSEYQKRPGNDDGRLPISRIGKSGMAVMPMAEVEKYNAWRRSQGATYNLPLWEAKKKMQNDRGYLRYLALKQKQNEALEKERKAAKALERRYQRENAKELRARTIEIMKEWNAFQGNPPKGYGENMLPETVMRYAYKRAKDEQKIFNETAGETAMQPRDVAPNGERMPQSAAETQDAELTYGKRPKSGWGKITVEEDPARPGDKYKKGTEFWIDPNGTMIRREPIGKTGKFKVDRKVEGFGWEHKGVMTGNDQNSFVGITDISDTLGYNPKPEGVPPERPQMWDPADEIPRAPMEETRDETPSPMAPKVQSRTPYTGYEGKGFGDVWRLAQDVYGSAERGLGAAKDAWNSDWGKKALPPENYDDPNYEPAMSREDEEIIRQIEEEQMLEDRRAWEKAQGWGTLAPTPKDYGFEKNADYGWY